MIVAVAVLVVLVPVLVEGVRDTFIRNTKIKRIGLVLRIHDHCYGEC